MDWEKKSLEYIDQSKLRSDNKYLKYKINCLIKDYMK